MSNIARVQRKNKDISQKGWVQVLYFSIHLGTDTYLYLNIQWY